MQDALNTATDYSVVVNNNYARHSPSLEDGWEGPRWENFQDRKGRGAAKSKKTSITPR